MATPNEVGRWLAQALKAANLTQTQLAQALGVRRGTVSDWVNGKTVPHKRNLNDVRRVLKQADEPDAEAPPEPPSEVRRVESEYLSDLNKRARRYTLDVLQAQLNDLRRQLD